jgi:hypothetical protein
MTDALERTLAEEFQSDIKTATSRQLHTAIGKVFMGEIKQRWDKSRAAHSEGRMAFYLSAEYLVGRVIYNNLFNLGITETVRKVLADAGIRQRERTRPDAMAARECPICGTVNAPTATLCWRCGSPLTQEFASSLEDLRREIEKTDEYRTALEAAVKSLAETRS